MMIYILEEIKKLHEDIYHGGLHCESLFYQLPKFWTILDQGSPVCDQRKEKRPEIFSHDYYIHVMNNS